MLIWVLPIDKMIITQTFTMASWQIVVKMSEATKPRKTKRQQKNKQANKTKNKTTTTKREEGLKKQLTEWSSDVVIIIDLR